MRRDELEPLTQDALVALRKEVPHATLESIGATPKEGAGPEVIEDLRAYFHHFAVPKGESNQCLRCDNALTGLAATILGDGGFEWGLAHGHGHCRCCGWPATLYHFIKDRHGNDLMTIRNILLQQHPDDIELRQKDAA